MGITGRGVLPATATNWLERERIDVAGGRRQPSRLVLALTVAVEIMLAGDGTLAWRWYRYVAMGDMPSDEVGIEVNLRLPELLRA